MRNIRLTVAYDGTNYVGWQIQPDQVTVQSVLTEAVRRLTQETVSLLAAGRTDSGVHAVGQVVNFRTASRIPIDNFVPGLHHFLPDDIAIVDADEVVDDFHATYSAKWKRYRYTLLNRRERHPFLGRYSWRVSQPLDAAAMHRAAERFVGTHDFRCFESHFPNKATSVRTVMSAAVHRHSECPMWNCPKSDSETNGGDFLSFDVVANGFLYNMVRAMTGTLLQVGLGHWSAEDVSRIIENQDRAQAGETAPPHGLALMHVEYDNEFSTSAD